MHEIWIEAESFENKGGWVVDTQSMPVIHSAYLMAHGMGVPVADATTQFTVEADGEYTVWVLTRDWTATWDIKDSAGIFRAKIDGEALPVVLGTNGRDWAWQSAGMVSLSAGVHTLALSDLSGFNGRCDALYFTDTEAAPSSAVADIDGMRKRLGYKEVEVCDTVYDLVVVGGGIAGICTAISAIRGGAKTLLLNDRPILGGCNSSEVRVAMAGRAKEGLYPELGNVVREITPVMGDPAIYRPEYFEDHRKTAVFEIGELASGRGSYRLNESVTELEKEGDRITAVISTNTLTGKKTKIKARLFADCSGDAVLARLGGATLMYGTESHDAYGETLAPPTEKRATMGHSIRWYSVKQPSYSDFPELDWNLPYNDDNYLNSTWGDWEQETGFYRDMVYEAEYIRDFGLRAIFANWSYQKHHCNGKERFANLKLEWVSAFGGKREGYRVLGDYVLTEHDLEAKTSYDDGTACITWGIDIHFPDPSNEKAFGEPFRSFAYHRGMPAYCPVPYRCLYAKGIDNLFLGGRIISASHIAFSAVRVMRTLGMLGEVIGMAASLCTKHGCLPRDIYTEHLDALKAMMARGVPVPDAFACGEISDTEKYHFKDMGFWHLTTGEITCNGIPITEKEVARFKASIDHLGLKHKHEIPKKWR